MFGRFLGSYKELGRNRRKVLLVLGILFNLLLIAYFKYSNFLVKTINDVFGQDLYIWKIILPLAISFFTFQQIAYLVDAYRGINKSYNFFQYSLFVSFFPQLIAGPIVHHKDVIPQFLKPSTYKINIESFSIGLTIFILGLSKKVLLADPLSVYVQYVFGAAGNGASIPFIDAWIGALAYTFQLYFDFSGYSDMAIGSARLFGIKIPANFNSPYKATSIIDFWRRWHITLSNFLRDYLYIPLGGNQKGTFRRGVNLMITMLLGGLWHGAGWTFIFWGGLHGIFLVINHRWNAFWKYFDKDKRKKSILGSACGWSITFLVVVVGWVFFRAESIGAAFIVLKGMVNLGELTAPSSPLSQLLSPRLYLILFSISMITFFAPNSQEWVNGSDNDALYQDSVNKIRILDRIGSAFLCLRWRPNRVWGFVISFLLFLSLKSLLTAQETEFLYFNF